MRDELITVVEGYLDGLRKKDLSRVAFAPDVTFESPLSPRLTGERAVVDFLSGLFPAIKDIWVRQHIVEGEYAATSGASVSFENRRIAKNHLPSGNCVSALRCELPET